MTNSHMWLVAIVLDITDLNNTVSPSYSLTAYSHWQTLVKSANFLLKKWIFTQKMMFLNLQL